jgi:hypothetical protein
MDHHVLSQATFSLAGLLGKNVALIAFSPHKLPRAGNLEAFGRSSIRFNFWHKTLPYQISIRNGMFWNKLSAELGHNRSF